MGGDFTKIQGIKCGNDNEHFLAKIIAARGISHQKDIHVHYAYKMLQFQRKKNM